MPNFEFEFSFQKENVSFSQENSFFMEGTLASFKEKLAYKKEISLLWHTRGIRFEYKF